MSGEHSPFGGSSLARRNLCPGSYRLEKDRPDVAGDDARLGTELHAEVAAQIRRRSDSGSHAPAKTFGIPDDDAVSACLDLWDSLEPDKYKVQAIEEKICAASIHELVGWTTPDLALATPFESGVVVDWKFTHQPVTPAPENLQLALYCAAVAEKYELENVKGIIVLAYDGTKSEVSYEMDDLGAIRQHIRQIVETCLLPFAPAIPSRDACRYCRALPCAAVLARAGRALEQIGEIPAAEKAHMLSGLIPLEPLIKRLKSDVCLAIRAGAEIPGWGIKQNRKSITLVQKES